MKGMKIQGRTSQKWFPVDSFSGTGIYGPGKVKDKYKDWLQRDSF